MHPLFGARVYKKGNDASLVLYRKVDTLYLCALFSQGGLRVGLVPFHLVLDLVPAGSRSLPRVTLPLCGTLNETLDEWKEDVKRELLRDARELPPLFQSRRRS